MNMKIAARMLAVLALIAAMTAAIMALRGHGMENAASHSLRHPGGEPANLELTRCRDLGIAAVDDDGCQRAWAESRRRFLGLDGSNRPVLPAPGRFCEGDKTSTPQKPVTPPVSQPVSP
ncbi:MULTISPECIES: putative entry exclusion protein TrbK-alt [unclassified Mesorhizobium]|uniref:putative entry exclusion protein TrbK-alt n=1 Tax=unclassified Mesorhizobium TaxID=325217 RepID=UPI0011280B1C|nr:MULTISPECIES: putative entry exclusion protein TrbK-alt [unclassified Mesorhizobium]TPK95316.1 conjugal transfer protein TrbK [Mesorhizobium sp. B2-4-16]TPL61011.1 conjugal transfer protein TrbK [Mesorhizobium sp. B2-4-3]